MRERPFRRAQQQPITDFQSPEIPSSFYCLPCGLEIDYCRSIFNLVPFCVRNQFSQHLSTLAERHLCTLAAN